MHFFCSVLFVVLSGIGDHSAPVPCCGPHCGGGRGRAVLIMDEASAMDESSESSTRAESDNCRQCERLEQLVKSLANDLRARDQLILCRIASLEDQLSAVLSRVSVPDPSTSNGGKKNKKMQKKSKASIEDQAGQDSTDRGHLSRSRSRARRRSSGSCTDREAIGSERVRSRTNSCSASANVRADSECTNSGPANRSTGSSSTSTSGTTRKSNSTSADELRSCTTVLDDPESCAPGKEAQASRSTEGPVKKPQSLSLPPLKDDDPSWQTISCERRRRRKRKDLFVGNLKTGTTGEFLTNFIQCRAQDVDKDVPVHNVKVFDQKEGKETITARVTVDAQDSALLKSKSFWPGRLYCRDYVYNQPNDKHASRTPAPSNEERASNIVAECIEGACSSDAADQDCHETRVTIQPNPPIGETAQHDIVSDFQLAISPESNWGESDHDGSSSEQSENADGATTDLLGATPRGKRKAHESITPPDIQKAKKADTQMPVVLPTTPDIHKAKKADTQTPGAIPSTTQ